MPSNLPSTVALAADQRNSPVARISVSMPEDLLAELDGMVSARGFESRSQAISEMINLHQQGKLRILAIMSESRQAGAFKDIPTTFEQGYKIDWPIWRGLYVGPKVSDADYKWWVDTLAKLTKTPEFAKEREARGLFPFDLLGADYDKRVKADVARFRALAKEAGL